MRPTVRRARSASASDFDEVPVLIKHLPTSDSLAISPYVRFTDTLTEESLEIGICNMVLSGQSLQQTMSRARACVCTNLDESIVARSLALAFHRVLEARTDVDAPGARIA
jgi:hypothetical protein